MTETLLHILPRANASLNGVAAVLLLIGFVLIKRGRQDAHKKVMVSAFAVSTLFLMSYMTYHSLKAGLHTPWEIEGWLRTVYYLILITHIVLAATVPFLAIALLWLGFKKRHTVHRKLAVFAWPIWMYVSVTGVLVYLLLYELQPRLLQP